MENHLNTWKLTCRILGRLRKILEISSAIYWPTTLWWIHLSLIDFDMSVLHQNWMFSCSGSDFWTIQNIWLLELYKCCFQFQSHVWWPNLPCFVNGQPFFSSRRRGKGPCGRGCWPVSWSKAHWVPFKKMDDMFLVDFWWHTWVFCWKNQCSPRVLHVFSMKFPRAPHFPARFWLIGRQSDEELFIWSVLQCTEMLGLNLWPPATAIVTTMMMIIIIYLYFIYCYYIITIWWLVIILIILIIMCISYFWPWAIMINVFCLSSGPTLDGSLNPLIFSSKWVLISYLAGVMLSTRPPSYELVYKSH